MSSSEEMSPTRADDAGTAGTGRASRRNRRSTDRAAESAAVEAARIGTSR